MVALATNKLTYLYKSNENKFTYPVSVCFRPALLNIYDMLRPCGQLIFTAFTKTPIDEAYDKLDGGKWGKYDNWKSHIPFHNHLDPKQGYDDLLKSTGYIDCHLIKESFVTFHTEESFEGKVFHHSFS